MAALFSALVVLVATTESSDLPASIEVQIQRATVRLTVRDENHIVYGSGTIVDVAGTTGLIVTCAHTFRHTRPGAPVEVTLFSPSGEEKLAGRLVSFNRESDVGLVRAEGIRGVSPIPLALPGYEPSVGQQVVVAGCDEGRSPSAEVTTIVVLNRFLGPDNIEVAAVPVDGRSGGGLFNARYELIGVCNGSEPVKQQGIYAGLPCIHEQLAQAEGKSHNQYANGGPSTDAAAEVDSLTAESRSIVSLSHLANGSRRNPPSDRASIHRPTDARRRADHSGTQRPIALTQDDKSGTEVVCIVRSRGAPASEIRVITLNNASAQFLRALEQEQRQNP